MSDRLKGLSPQEKAACLITESARSCRYPVGREGPTGGVDAMLTLRDGRQAAFEVTALAAVDAVQTDALLGRDDFSSPSPGQWWWTVQVGSRRNLPRLRTSYSHIALLREAEGVTRPEHLWRRHQALDADVVWLVEDSTSDMWGHPGLPAVDGDKVRDTMVVPAGRGGEVDHSLYGLNQALLDAFAEPAMPRHSRSSPARKQTSGTCSSRYTAMLCPSPSLTRAGPAPASPPEPPPAWHRGPSGGVIATHSFPATNRYPASSGSNVVVSTVSPTLCNCATSSS